MPTPPTPTARVVPTGYKLPDGFKATVTLGNIPNIKFWEKEVTPPGLDAGPKIDTTTMLNTKYRTAALRQLVTVDDGSANVAFDPDVLSDILAQIGVNQNVTYRYGDGTTYAVWGGLNSFKVSGLTEGQMPMASASFATTNQDNTTAEAGPVLTAAGGT